MEEKIFALLLPDHAHVARRAWRAAQSADPSSVLCEVRVRTEHLASLVLRRKDTLVNLPLSFSLSDGEMRALLSRVCLGSVYAFEESLKEGYVSLEGGIRVGVGGRALMRDGRVTGIGEVRSLVFRIPKRQKGIADALAQFFRERGEGVLLFSPPGYGKTTLLRELARTLSAGKDALRCAVIDTRGELSGFERECLVDILSGYPKAVGARLAVRTLSPELLLMDEIGESERAALRDFSAFGVPLIASAHAHSAHDAYRSFLSLFEEGVFRSLWDVRRNATAALPAGVTV